MLPPPPSPRWLRRAQESQNIQDNKDGTAHPNTKGHRETAKLVAKTLRIDVPSPPPDGFTVRFLRVRLTNTSTVKLPEAGHRVTLAVEDGFRNACGHVNEPVTVTLGRTLDLTANPCVRYPVRTVGRTIAMSATASLLIGPERPPIGEPGPRQSVTLKARQLRRRGRGWNATPSAGSTYAVRHAVGEHPRGLRIEFDYELTKDPVTAPAP